MFGPTQARPRVPDRLLRAAVAWLALEPSRSFPSARARSPRRSRDLRRRRERRRLRSGAVGRPAPAGRRVAALSRPRRHRGAAKRRAPGRSYGCGIPSRFSWRRFRGRRSVELTDGRIVRLAYAGRNGQPYTSIGRVLIESGEIAAARNVAGRLKAGCAPTARRRASQGAQPHAAQPSYVFFKLERVRPAEGRSAARGSALTALRSIAVDRTFGPMDAVLARRPSCLAKAPSPQPFRRLTIAQDTGSAIVGAARADLFFGGGDEAGRRAGDDPARLRFHRAAAARGGAVKEPRPAPRPSPAPPHRRGDRSLDRRRQERLAAQGREAAEPAQERAAAEASPPPRAGVRRFAATSAKPKPPAPPPLAPLERRLKRQFAQGRSAIDQSIDLHGMNQAQAHQALRGFLSFAQAAATGSFSSSPARAPPRRGAGFCLSEEPGVLRRMRAALAACARYARDRARFRGGRARAWRRGRALRAAAQERSRRALSARGRALTAARRDARRARLHGEGSQMATRDRSFGARQFARRHHRDDRGRLSVAQNMLKGAMTLIDEPRAEASTPRASRRRSCRAARPPTRSSASASFGVQDAPISARSRTTRSAMPSPPTSARPASIIRPGMRATGPATGRCFVYVTPDGERTMNTYLGASTYLSPPDVDEDARPRRAGIIYLEGYMWDRPAAKAAFQKAATHRPCGGRSGRADFVGFVLRRSLSRRISRSDAHAAWSTHLLQHRRGVFALQTADFDARARSIARRRRARRRDALGEGLGRRHGDETRRSAGLSRRPRDRHDRRGRSVRRRLSRRHGARRRLCRLRAGSARSPRPKSSSISAPGRRSIWRRSPPSTGSSSEPPRRGAAQSLRSATSSMRWLAPLVSSRLARGRVGRMFSRRLTRLIRVQIERAIACAASSPRSAYLWK